MAPLLIYPSCLGPPTSPQLSSIKTAARVVLSTGRWAPWDVLPAIGAYWRVPGAPRLPEASISASAVTSMLRDGYWAPPGAPRPAHDHWNYCRRWAASPLPARPARFAAAERRAKNAIIGLYLVANGSRRYGLVGLFLETATSNLFPGPCLQTTRQPGTPAGTAGFT